MEKKRLQQNVIIYRKGKKNPTNKGKYTIKDVNQPLKEDSMEIK